ncbi:DNA mismatch repair protein MutL [Marininema mesophilum]|uniref:DNA mismatch repair protein MutL n=1 Tax=Marininema mesophilum TaxID=1048340 RepID=A0A1H2ZES6_9BACL|nr:DNA mismatch repair endonuclease MutL [Marininema mesophilum]SDX15876.1 DNA mismatch repair protein MutL [Marininema mesophilum]
MGKIRILDNNLANQIAAGEVVERPASVVKELVENSLDAGADRIQVAIEEGGIRSIHVSDNGQGMDREDALRAFERHATSKIRRERDLFSIRSLGFRGEALPSIASVSRLTLTTSAGEGEAAACVRMDGGKSTAVEDAVRSQGTEVLVEDLFFNTPARLKYLKTVNTEVSHVADSMGRLALAHPRVSILLTHNGRELFRTPGDGKLLHVVHALYGKQVARQAMSIVAEDMDFSVTGMIIRPEITRSNRSYISTVINGRFIRNISIVQAVLRAYDTLLPIGRYPITVLSIEMDPKLVDVNVHPAKLEVRLSKEKELCRLIEEEVRQLFRRQVLIPEAKSPRERPVSRPVQDRLRLENPSQGQETKPPNREWKSPIGRVEEGEIRENASSYLKLSPIQDTLSEKPSVSQPTASREDVLQTPGPNIKDRLIQEAKESNQEFDQETLPSPSSGNDRGTMYEKRTGIPHDLLPLAQVHGTYILAQAESGFYILDQHAAHERIYYEIFYRRLQEKNQDQQPLLVPVTIECTPGEAETIRQRTPELEELGVELESFGTTAFLIRSHPRWLPKGEEESMIREIVDWMKSGKKVEQALLLDDGAKMMACKAAIKANRHLRREEMESLIHQLRECETPYTCPHGRPVLIHFSTYEIEKMFKRVM